MLPCGVGTWVRLVLFIFLMLLAACSSPAILPSPNLDAETRTLIAQAERVVFVIPFSHWDTDWHENFADYVKRSDQNILTAIQMAKAHPRFRFALEQVLFVQHF